MSPDRWRCWPACSRPEPDPAAERDYHEPRASRSAVAYARDWRIFVPIGRLFALAREISAAISHEVGASAEWLPVCAAR